jgi:uncharacterized protein
MSRVFADTLYYLALVNSRDEGHAKALAASRSQAIRVITTAWVLTQVANAVADSGLRRSFPDLLDGLLADPDTLILPATGEIFDSGVALYRRYADKEWSLTDCISFAVMRRHRLDRALTADHHFTQAGFKALLADRGRSAPAFHRSASYPGVEHFHGE